MPAAHQHPPTHSHTHHSVSGHDHPLPVVSPRAEFSPILANVWARLLSVLAVLGVMWLLVVWALGADA